MFNEYPYVNLQDVNLDWILKHIKELEINLQNFIKLNTIKYANPIIWNITTQYETNTVVIDGNTGTAYLSVAPVPTGIALTNTDYWTPIFTLNLLSANQNITFWDDGTNVIATFASDTGDWLLWNFYLYRVTQPISVNTAYVEGFNIERFSVELFIKDYINTLAGIIGDLDDLTTSDKTSIVNAIIELVSNIGDLNDLTTSDKTSIVNAIVELVSNIGDLNDLTTSDKTSIVNAINSLVITRVDYIPYITGDFTDVEIGKNINVGGYYSENDGGNGIWQRVNAEIPNITYNHSGAYYKPVAINGFVNVKQFGVIGNFDNTGTVKTDNLNKINAVVTASVYNGLIVPSDVNYGYNSHATNRINIDLSASTIKLMIYDYSVDDSYNDPRAEAACVCRVYMFTPDALGEGQHDGNGLILRGATNPYLAIMNDNLNTNEGRASLLFAVNDQSTHNHVYDWQISESYWAHDKSFNITRLYYDALLDLVTSKNFISFGYDNDSILFGNKAADSNSHPFELYQIYPTVIHDGSQPILQYLDAETGFTKRLDILYVNGAMRFGDINANKLDINLDYNNFKWLQTNQIISFATDAVNNAFSVSDYGYNADLFTVSAKGQGKFANGVSGGYYYSANRPTGVTTGTMIYDATIGKPIWWNGANWIDATGAAV